MAALSRLMREPLLHFLVLGAGLFGLFYQVSEPVDTYAANRIVITNADIERLSAHWQRQWKRTPTDEELDGLVQAYIREEILYREALALGLDQNDVIVRRRLGQKLEFLFKDLAEQAEPSDDELERFLADNAERYTVPGRLSFTHVYFNRDKRGPGADEDARNALARLRGAQGPLHAPEIGDRFLYQYRFENQSPAQVSRIFGREFAERLQATAPGEWQGPVESGYGVHLVFVTQRTEAFQPELAEVRDKVRWDWIAERRKQIDAGFYRELRARYQVEFERDERT